MLIIPRKIYYLKTTGQFVLDTGESRGANIRQTTTSEDFKSYSQLQAYTEHSVGCIELKVGQFQEDFLQCESFRVNPDTKKLEFSYRDETNAPTPYQKPLSVEIQELRESQADLWELVLFGGAE